MPTASMLRALLALVHGLVRSRLAMQVEILALRHQLAVYQRTCSRPRLRPADRLLWVWLSRVWSGWQDALVFVKPETVIAWRCRKFRQYWTRLTRSGKAGRPSIPREVRDLIRRMSLANPLWGAPRIAGELAKIGMDLPRSTVAKSMVRRRRPPSATWRAFLKNHVREIVEAFPWTDPPKYLLRDRDQIYGARFRHRVAGLGCDEVVIAAQSPWQNPYVERLIGSIRRECLDHTIVLGERHLKHVLTDYFRYYHRWRTQQSLEMDCPEGREIHPVDRGRVVETDEVGGLHHHYERVAA